MAPSITSVEFAGHWQPLATPSTDLLAHLMLEATHVGGQHTTFEDGLPPKATGDHAAVEASTTVQLCNISGPEKTGQDSNLRTRRYLTVDRLGPHNFGAQSGSPDPPQPFGQGMNDVAESGGVSVG